MPARATICRVDLGLKDRGALVTAASKGLGRACAELLIAEGARVFISSRHPEATAREIGAAGSSARDVSKTGDPEALVDEAVDRLGRLDILIVNAGGPPFGTFQDVPLDAWEAAFQLTVEVAPSKFGAPFEKGVLTVKAPKVAVAKKGNEDRGQGGCVSCPQD